MPKPVFLYFDLGNVLLSFCNDRRGRQMAEAAGAPLDLVRQVLFHADGENSALWRFERGELDAAELYERFCQHTGCRPEMAALYEAGCNMFDEIPASVNLVSRLAQAGNRLGILSNTNPVDWQFVTSGRFPFLNEHFEHAVLSFEAKAMKPEAAIFKHAVARTGALAGDVFFVDDMPVNVAGARAAGLDAVQFTTVAALERELRSRGVEGA
jgi:glucose-1-phosphatase